LLIPGSGHHCAENQPSGFCWLNNVHISIAHAAKAHGLTHAVILDFDLHHGDGSQAITWSLNDLASSGSTAKSKTYGVPVPRIGYFSLHDINSYPCEYGDKNKIQSASINLSAHGQFIQNVHLSPYSTREEFWQLYEDRYAVIFTKAREFLTSAASCKPRKNREFKPAVFLSAGFDASEHESQYMQRHNVNVPTDFFAKFTADAVALSNELCSGRVVSVLEGGYSDRALTSGVLAHVSALSCVPPDVAVFVPPSMSVLNPSNQHHHNQHGQRQVAWDPDWWDLRRMEELERVTLAAKAPKRVEKRSTFMDSTAASQARVVAAAAASDTPTRRVSSSSSAASSPHHAPPAPPKPWEAQTAELSRCFLVPVKEPRAIPAVERTRSVATPAPTAAAPAAGKEMTMTLRERKPRVSVPGNGPADRRRTIDRTTAPPVAAAAAAQPAHGSRGAGGGGGRQKGVGLAGRESNKPVAGSPGRSKLPEATEAVVERYGKEEEDEEEELSGRLARVKITFNREKAIREDLEREGGGVGVVAAGAGAGVGVGVGMGVKEHEAKKPTTPPALNGNGLKESVHSAGRGTATTIATVGGSGGSGDPPRPATAAAAGGGGVRKSSLDMTFRGGEIRFAPGSTAAAAGR
jgi:histone deacetylase HOS3